MATIPPVSHLSESGFYEVILWEGIATGDTITPVVIKQTPLSLSLQAVATAAGSATVVLNGSNISGAGTLYPLNDLTGGAVSLTASGGAEIADRPLAVAPGISGGTDDDWDIYLLVRYA